MTELATKPTELGVADDVDPADTPVGNHPVSPASLRPVSWIGVWAVLALLAIVGTALASVALHSTDVSLLEILALLVCLLAAGFDASTGRIPNPITYTAILAGLSINTLASAAQALNHAPPQWLGVAGVGPAFIGFGTCAIIGLACLLLAGMGGGDMKLLVAMGAILGYIVTFQLMFWTLLIAIPYSLINLLIAGRLNSVVRSAALQLMQIVYLRQLEPSEVASSRRIPMALPLAAAMFAMKAMPLSRFGF